MKLWIALLPTIVLAQTAQIGGVVRDSSGAAVPGAVLTAVNEENGMRRQAVTDNAGQYSLSTKWPGLYKITVRREGFRTATSYGVKLEADRRVRLDFTLYVGPAEESITVHGLRTLVKTEDAALGAVVGRRFMEDLPLNGRGMADLLDSAPGVVITPAGDSEAGQFVANGQRANTNLISIDGVSFNAGIGVGLPNTSPGQAAGGMVPAYSAIGSFHGLISVDAVEEFRILTSTPTAAYGRLFGAQVSLISRSGGNQLHGGAQFHGRHGSLNANDFFRNREGLPRSGESLTDLGFQVGGPIRRDRTYFFGNFERLRLLMPYTETARVPTASERLGASSALRGVLQAFPISSTAPESGLYTISKSQPSSTTNASFRLDHTFGSRAHTFLRWSWAPSEQNGYESASTPANAGNALRVRSTAVTAGATIDLGGRSIADLRFGWLRTTSIFEERPTGGAGLTQEAIAAVNPYATSPGQTNISVFLLPIYSYVNWGTTRRKLNQYQANGIVNLPRGPHEFLLGADYRRTVPDLPGPLHTVSMLFRDQAAMRSGTISSLSITTQQPVSMNFGAVSSFVQDTWRPLPRLTLSLGVRWEYNPPPRASGGRPLYVVTGLGQASGPKVQAVYAALWRRSLRDFAPRGGVALRLDESGATVLRAGGGLYYGLGTALASDVMNSAPYVTSTLDVDVPLGQAKLAVPSFALKAPYGRMTAFDENFRSPRVYQWNVTLERALARMMSFSAAYVGAAGRELLRREAWMKPSADFEYVELVRNGSWSDYHAMQFQLRTHPARSLQLSAAYTWSHSIDTGSRDGLYVAPEAIVPIISERGSSDFDVRHLANAAGSWQPKFARGWTLAGIARFRTAFPMTLYTREGLLWLGGGPARVYRPDLVAGVPVWIDDADAPGGRRLNYDAFALPQAGRQGTLGRNAIRGFGFSQIDLSISRRFELNERVGLQLRIDAFNALNTPSFGDPDSDWAPGALFGRATRMLDQALGTGRPWGGLIPSLQIGGPRCLQMGLRFSF